MKLSFASFIWIDILKIFRNNFDNLPIYILQASIVINYFTVPYIFVCEKFLPNGQDHHIRKHKTFKSIYFSSLGFYLKLAIKSLNLLHYKKNIMKINTNFFNIKWFEALFLCLIHLNLNEMRKNEFEHSHLKQLQADLYPLALWPNHIFFNELTVMRASQ